MALLVSPNTVLISAGVDNQYGHPDSKAVKLYGQVAKHVFQTNIENGVSLHTKRKGDDFLTRPRILIRSQGACLGRGASFGSFSPTYTGWTIGRKSP